MTSEGAPERVRAQTDRSLVDLGTIPAGTVPAGTVLEVDNVSKWYPPSEPGGTVFQALSDVTLRVTQNELITVLGPSGCGKTTLLRLIAGFEAPSRGRVLFEGAEVSSPGSDRVVVFQQPGLYPWLSVRDNVAFGLRAGSRRPWHRPKPDWDKVDETIAIVGLKGFEKRPPYELSGGMQQRAALARALVMSPRLLLMDEPFGALDAHTRPAMQEFLLQLWDRLRATIFFVTHDVDEAVLLGDRVVVMASAPGRVADEMAVDIGRPRHESVIETARFRLLRRRAVSTLRGAATGSGAEGGQLGPSAASEGYPMGSGRRTEQLHGQP